jgi:hypothetical protein
MRFLEEISHVGFKQITVRRLFGAIDVDQIFLVPQFIEPFFCKQDRFF